MRWERGRRSSNLEDRRGQGSARRGGFRLPRRGAARGGARRAPKLSLGGIALIVVAYLVLGEDVLPILLGNDGLGSGGASVSLPGSTASPQAGGAAAGPLRTTPEEESLVDFVSFVLDDVQKTWGEKLPGYRETRLVLFRNSTPSACGTGQAAMGPFYCPGDQKVYVDLGFYAELKSRFRAPGDFAQAYVLAHEVGHHIQNLVGTNAEVRRAQKASPRQANALSVRMELQADCLAGVWGHSANQRGVLEPGDIEEGLRAAAAIGDDHIQSMSGRGVRPESFTHGSSDQRMKWLRRGLASGDPNACDTFSGR